MASMNDASAAEISGMLNGMALPGATLRSSEDSGATERISMSPTKRKRVANLVSKPDPLSNGSGKLKRPNRFQEDKVKDSRSLGIPKDIFDISNDVVTNTALPHRKPPVETHKISGRVTIRGKGRPRKIEGVRPPQTPERKATSTTRNIRNSRSSALPEDIIWNPNWSRKPEHTLRSKRKVRRVHIVDLETDPITTTLIKGSSRESGPSTEGDSGGAQAQRTRDSQQELLGQSPVNTGLEGVSYQADGHSSGEHSATRKKRAGRDDSGESLEDIDEAEDGHDPSGADYDENLHFFGAFDAWKMVLASARKVSRFSEANQRDDMELPLRTTTGKSFVKSVGKVSSLYRTLASLEDTQYENRKEAQRQLSARLDRIEELVDNLREHHAAERRERGATVQDIYAHAIPSLVMLLRYACQCRNDDYSKPTNTRALREIIRIQSVTIEVCEIARAWKVKPTTSIPIVKPTSQGILPYLRDVREAFQDELQSREERSKQEKNDAKLARSHADVRRADAKAREENEKLRKQRCKEMRNRLLQNKCELFGGVSTPRSSIRDVSEELPIADGNTSTSTSEPKASDQSQQRCVSSHADLSSAGFWTHAEEVELMKQLLRLQHLQGETRILAILNTPILQNKLPEHVRQKALEWKPAMIMCSQLEDAPAILGQDLIEGI